jgi:hypothetical protein
MPAIRRFLCHVLIAGCDDETMNDTRARVALPLAEKQQPGSGLIVSLRILRLRKGSVFCGARGPVTPGCRHGDIAALDSSESLSGLTSLMMSTFAYHHDCGTMKS